MGKWDFAIAIGGLVALGLGVWIFRPEICKAVPKLPGLCIDFEEFEQIQEKDDFGIGAGEGDVSLEGDMIGGQEPYFCPEGMFFDHCGCKCVPNGTVVAMCYRQCPSPPAYVPGPGHTSYLPVYKKEAAIAGDPNITNACIRRCSSVPYAGGPEGNLECMAACTSEILIRQGLY